MTISEIKLDILEGIVGFLKDPPDTDFQEGFLAALLSLAETLGLSGHTIVRDGRAVLNPLVR